MRKSRFSDQQIALAVQQVEHGASVAEVCRKLGIAEQTYYRWKKKFGEMAPVGPSRASGFRRSFSMNLGASWSRSSRATSVAALGRFRGAR